MKVGGSGLRGTEEDTHKRISGLDHPLDQVNFFIQCGDVSIRLITIRLYFLFSSSRQSRRAAANAPKDR
jgi:hypothetical protein